MSSQRENTSNMEKGGNKLIGVIVAVSAVCVVLVGVIVYLVVSQKNNSGEVYQETAEKRNTVVTADNAESIVEEMLNVQPTRPGYYTVAMNNVWHFADGASASIDAQVENDPGNSHDVFFDVFLAENEGDAIYKSPVIPRGSRLTDITLDKDLDAGTYDCVMIYHLVDEEQTTVATLRVGFTIIVEN